MNKASWFCILLAVVISVTTFTYYWSYDRYVPGNWIIVDHKAYLIKYSHHHFVVLQRWGGKEPFIVIDNEKLSMYERLSVPLVGFNDAASIELYNILKGR